MSNTSSQLVKSFILKTLGLTIAVVAAGAALFVSVLKPYFLPVYIPFLVLIVLLTLTTGIILIKSLTRQPKRFVNHYFLSTIIKFFAYLIFFIIYVFNNRQDAVPFTMVFFGLYIIYTAFELGQILKFTKIKH